MENRIVKYNGMVKYKGIKIIIKNTKYSFKFYTTEYRNTLIIIFGALDVNRSMVIHKAIEKFKKTRR